MGLTRRQLISDKDGHLSLVLTHTKSGRLRTIRLNGTAEDIVERQPIKGVLVFHHDGKRFLSAPGRFRDIRIWVTANDRTFPQFRAHDLRHFWAVQALRSGTSIYAVS